MAVEASLQEAVTAVLRSAEAEGQDPVDRLIPLIYDDLRAMAHRQLTGERRGHTLNTTALVHEAYLKLVDKTQVSARGQTYFFGAAARAMRQILVDHARRRKRHKRGGGEQPITLQTQHLGLNDFAADLVDLDAALRRLAALNPRHVRVVECRFFGGLNMEETAAALGIAQRTVRHDWALAKAWLHRELRNDES